MANENETELTFGEKAVGKTFNPSKSEEVEAIKTASANFIDVVCGPEAEKFDFKGNAEASAMRKLAQRHAQEASMWAVKAATWEAE